MPILMPTVALWKTLGAPHPLGAVAPSTDSVLGDWALKPARVRRRRFVVGVNERTLMAVAFAERTPEVLPGTFAACVGVQLATFGIADERILTEVAALERATFGKTRSRPLLGILNEVAFQFEVAAERRPIESPDDLLELQTALNEIPHRAGSRSCSFAVDSIVALLGNPTLH